MSDTPGERVREARRRQGWSQGELSRRTGLRPETISRLETGKHGVGSDSASAIADATGVTIDWLLHGDGGATPGAEDVLEAFLSEAPGVTDDERRVMQSIDWGPFRPSKITYSMVWGALRTCERR